MLIKTLSKLVEFQTISSDTNENRRALEWITKQLKDIHLYIRKFVFNGHPSLVITTKNTKKPIIFLQAHLDVVPGSPKMFKPIKKDGKLIGRGVYDMKYATACYIKLLKSLSKNLTKYNLGVMITTDEELGGFNGVSALLNKGFTSSVCFLPDGGDNWNFQESAKGVLHLSILSKGKSAHASKPWKGTNAIDSLFDYFYELKKYFPNEPCNDKNHNHNTISIGKFTGGEVANIIPDTAEALVDIRFTSETDKKEIMTLLNKTMKSFRNLKIKKLVSGNAYKSDKNSSYLKMFSKIAYEKFKIKTSFVISHGSSDARFFAEKGIDTILIRPKGGLIHSENEWIDINELEKFYVVLEEFVKKAAVQKSD